MICLKVQKKLITYLDNELGQKERTKIEEHLSSCSLCSEELNNLSRVFDAFSLYEEIEPSPHFGNLIRQRIVSQQKRSVSFIEIFKFAIKKPLPKIAVLLLLIGLFITPAIVRKSSASTKILVNVDGMTANCCEPIKANLREIAGIKEVSITPNSGTVCITLKEEKQVNLKKIEKAICDAGPYSCKDFNVISSSRKKINNREEVRKR